MEFQKGVSRAARQRMNTAGLRSGLILQQHPSCGEEERIFVVRFLARFSVVHGMEFCLAIRVGKMIGEGVGSAGMVLVRAGPEYPALRVNLLVGNPAVICDGSGGGAPQFVENDSRLV